MRFVPLIAAALPILVFGQRDIPVFRAETTLATVRFHVVQKKHYVDDLKREDIVVLEDGVPRNLTLFEGGRLTRRTIPVELSLVFDISGSVTQEGLLDPLVFKTTVLDGLGNVRLSVYGFDSNLKRFCRPTRDFEELKSCLSRVQNYRGGAKPRPEVIPVQLPRKRKADSRGGTWIFESVMAAAKDGAAGEANVTRIILVFSDGFPTTNIRAEDVAPSINEYGIPVYPVVLGHERIKQQIK